MPAQITSAVADFAQSALNASRVGTWQRDPTTGLLRCDAVTAEIFGLDDLEAMAEHGLSVDQLRQLVVPEDRDLFDTKDRAVREIGGPFVIEYRIAPSEGQVRWVLVRGRYEERQPGAECAAGTGIVIDITGSKADGHVEDHAFFARPVDEDGVEPIHRACDHAIGLRREIERMGKAVPGLKEATDLVLALLGRRLARDVDLANLQQPANGTSRKKRRTN